MRGERRVPYVTITICVSTMVAIAGFIAYFWPALLVLFDPARIGHQYYVASESMRPTLERNERIAPLRITAGALRRGVVIVFQASEDTRIDRIAAVGGDTVALKGGVVIVNGQPAPQRLVGAGPTMDGQATHLLLERLPGENHWHRILDAGYSDFDDWGPMRVSADNLFVLGDNRDRSADSRVPLREMGAGMVPVTRVIGIVDTVSWSGKRSRIGRSVDEPAPEGSAPK